MSQLNSNIDPRKLIAAAAAVGNTTKLQNATAPPAQGSPAETQNEPKRTSGPKSIIESRLQRVSLDNAYNINMTNIILARGKTRAPSWKMITTTITT